MIAAAPATSPWEEVARPVSLYSLRSTAEQYCILLVASYIGVLTTTTETIVLPALVSVGTALPGATAETEAAIVSAYLACSGISGLFWGPVSDYAGRRRPLLLALVFYLALTAACVFAPSAQTLVALRAAQGVVAGAALNIPQGVVADTFAPSRRGLAMGIFFAATQLGRILSPIIGGLVTAAMDWRAVFLFCAALSTPMLPMAWALPETQQWQFLQRKRAGTEPPLPLYTLLPTAEELVGQVAEPRIVSPLALIGYLLQQDIAPPVFLQAVSLGSLSVMSAALPNLLASPPFSFGPSIVGACYVPVGVVMMASNVFGGRCSDAAAAAHSGQPHARLVPALLIACCVPAGCFTFGWCAWAATQARVTQERGGAAACLAIAMAGAVLTGGGQAGYRSGFYAFLTAKKQRVAAGAVGASGAVVYAVAAALVSVSVTLQAAVGTGGLFSILAALDVAALAWAAASVAKARRASASNGGQPITASGRAVAEDPAETRRGAAVEELSTSSRDAELDVDAERRARRSEAHPSNNGLASTRPHV